LGAYSLIFKEAPLSSRPEGLLPFFLSKSHQEYSPIPIDGKGALDEVTVFDEKGENGVRAHSVDFVLKSKITVILSRGIQDSADLAFVGTQHGIEFALVWRSLADRNLLKIDTLSAQPVCRISARGAGLVGIDFEHVDGCFRLTEFQLKSQVKSLEWKNGGVLGEVQVLTEGTIASPWRAGILERSEENTVTPAQIKKLIPTGL